MYKSIRTCGCGATIHESIDGDQCARCLQMPDKEVRALVEKIEDLFGKWGNKGGILYSYLSSFKSKIENQVYPKDLVDKLVAAAQELPEAIPHPDDRGDANVHIEPTTIFIFSHALRELQEAILPRFRIYGTYWKDLDNEETYDKVVSAPDAKTALAAARDEVERISCGLSHNLEVAWEVGKDE